MNTSLMTTGKWIGGFILTVILALVIYLGAVLQVYILAWIIELIGTIF